LSKILAVALVGLTLAIERESMRAFCEVLLTKDREIPIAIKAMATIRIERQNYRLPFTRFRHSGADILDYACGLVTKHDRHGIAESAINDFEICMAKSRRPHSHQHVGWS
jgi:hypothetical protein